MFYQELSTELGKLFYQIAGIDGSVSPGEKEALQKCISKKWKPMEGTTDRYGTDQAYLIFLLNLKNQSLFRKIISNYFKSFTFRKNQPSAAKSLQYFKNQPVDCRCLQKEK